MLGLEKPDQGKVFIEGRDTAPFRKKDWDRLMHEFGVVFQGAALFDSLSVLENVGIRLFEERILRPQDIREKVVTALEKVKLNPDILLKYPNELSGGMQKRVGIARAIIHQPRFLLYDEPTSGLDPISAEAIDKLMLELSDDPERTSIMVTHDLASLRRLATQVVMIHDRKILFDGSPEDFFGHSHPEIKAFVSR